MTAAIMTPQRVALLGGLLAAMGPVAMAAFTPALPTIATYWEVSPKIAALTMSVYFAGFALSMLVSGPLSDSIGRKPTIIGLLVIFLIGTAVGGLAQSLEMLFLGRFLQGVGASVGVSVARAIVRDQFTGQDAARILNLVAMILGVGPAVAPSLGALCMQLFGWPAIFAMLFVFALVALVLTIALLRETRPEGAAPFSIGGTLGAYRMLIRSREFLFAAMALCGGVGYFYACAILLPFVLMDSLGLSPSQFGFGMIMQSGAFVAGSIALRQALRKGSIRQALPIGMTTIALASVALAVGLRVFEPNFWLVMVPAAFYAFGGAFISPAMTMASLAPFPKNAGAAAALSGFAQMVGGMGLGTLGGMIFAPLTAFATIIPLMGGMVIFAVWRWSKRTAMV